MALKALPRRLAVDRCRPERLLKEARAAAALNHPNICTVHEVGFVSNHFCGTGPAGGGGCPNGWLCCPDGSCLSPNATCP